MVLNNFVQFFYSNYTLLQINLNRSLVFQFSLVSHRSERVLISLVPCDLRLVLFRLQNSANLLLAGIVVQITVTDRRDTAESGVVVFFIVSQRGLCVALEIYCFITFDLRRLADMGLDEPLAFVLLVIQNLLRIQTRIQNLIVDIAGPHKSLMFRRCLLVSLHVACARHASFGLGDVFI